MKEKRKHRRFNLKDRPQVLDAKSSKLIGNILDISQDGFKMVTLDKMEQGKEYFLKIALPSSKGKKEFIDVTARVQWCAKEVDFELSTLGCYLVKVNVSGKFSLATFIFNNLNN